MTTLREAAQMALTLLETLSEQKTVQRQYGYAVINSLRELLSKPEQEPVAWMHNFIDEVVIAHRPADLDRHPDRWTALYKDPPPCQTCEALARTVMMDQTYHDSVMAQHRKPPTQDLSAPLTVNGVPMYPQREWQGLTDEEANELTYASIAEIEAKLKEKNGL